MYGTCTTPLLLSYNPSTVAIYVAILAILANYNFNTNKHKRIHYAINTTLTH